MKKIIFLLGFFTLSGCVPSSYYSRGVYHRVEKDQTLWRISRVYRVKLDKVVRVNRLKDARKIRVGQSIFIPGVTRVKHVEPYRRGSVSVAAKPEGEPIYKDEIDFIWPVKGEIVSKFGTTKTKSQKGIDIKTNLGSGVIAAAEGTVSFCGNLRGYGGTIIVKHKNDFSTVYSHIGSFNIKEGDSIKQGERVATVGKTGFTDFPKLHFEIRHKGKAVNPIFYLP